MKSILSNILTLEIDYRNRTYGLDIMRSAAILMVVIGHSMIFFTNWYETRLFGLNVYPGSIISILVTGFDGVDLFFVLSGFLIGTILLNLFDKSENFNLGTVANFWKRRWLRTIPAYFIILTLNIILAILFHTEQVTSFFQVIKYYIFCQNLVKGGLLFFPESWSLSVEEWFYLSLPIFMVLFYSIKGKKISKKYFIFSLLLFYLGAITSLRISNCIDCTGDWNTCIRTSVLMRLDTILFGVLAAWFKFYYQEIWYKYRNYCFVAGIILLLFNFYLGFTHNNNFNNHEFFKTIYFTFVGIGMMLLLPKAESIKSGNGFFLKAITYTSLASYSMYLVNYSIIFQLFNKLVKIGSINEACLSFMSFWIIVYIVSILLYKYVEQPILKYRDRIT